MKKLRCAVYTRKSSEEGLEQEFNSLDAQREACAAYITSQKHEGWVLLPTQYDDGGLSGGSLDRPALKQLLQDIADGLVDQVVVYKIDRLTRSLADFAKMVERLDAAGTSFVSVTQSFNTATSMGRLTLNMLLSFAQFEREVTAERIRDKIAASKRRGLWMGGSVPLGYDADGRTLKVNPCEAKTIRTLFDLYEQHGSVRAVKEQADLQGLRTKERVTADGQPKGGGPFERSHIHHILTNPIYAGRIRHKALVHEGQHAAIIDPDRWAHIQQRLQDGAAKGRARKTATQQSLLCGKLFDETGDRLTPSHTKTKAGVRLRYYISHRLVKRSGEPGVDGWRLPAPELEGRIVELVRERLRRPSFAAAIAATASGSDIAANSAALKNITTSATALLRLVARIDLRPGSLTVTLDPTRLATLCSAAAHAIDQEILTLSAPFLMRKRGVETKLILQDTPIDPDQTLIRNIAKAHQWYQQVKAGQTLSDIARDAGTSTRRIQHMIDLAFLAPDLVGQVLAGTQPAGFTSDWFKRHSLPGEWQDQRDLIATLTHR